MPELKLMQALADPKLRPALLAWAKRTYVDDQVEFLLDVNAKKKPDDLYKAYIRQGAPNLINLQDNELKPWRQLAAKGKTAKPADVNAAVAKVFKAQLLFMTPIFEGGTNAFLTSPEYQEHLSKTTGGTPAARAVASLKLSASNATKIAGLLEVYLHGRTISDVWQAYVGMQKIVAKAKLDPALTLAGKPVAGVQRDYKSYQAAEALKPLVAEAVRYLTTAIQSVTTQGLKDVSDREITRMFDSGRMRHDKVVAAWNKAIQGDPTFKTKYAQLATDKGKSDTLWATYRSKLKQ